MCRAALVTSEHLVDNTLESLIAEGVGNQEFVYPMRYSSAVPVDIGNFFWGVHTWFRLDLWELPYNFISHLVDELIRITGGLFVLDASHRN